MTENKEPGQDQLLDSNYDDIQEYDNNLPRWWVYLFYLTIIFSVIYPVYRTLGPDTEAELDSQLREISKLKESAVLAAAAKGLPGDIELIALAKNAEALEEGTQIFATRCMPCHGEFAQGIVGPNLTDNYWIHGGRPSQIRHIISEGVPEKGMITWKAIISDKEINNVTAYVFTLKGTNPQNPKAPEGNLEN